MSSLYNRLKQYMYYPHYLQLTILLKLVKETTGSPVQVPEYGAYR